MNGHKDTGPDTSLAAELEESRRRWLEAGIPAPEALLVTGSGLSLNLGEPAAGPWPFSDLFPFDVEAIEGHAVTAELVRTGNGRLVLYSRGRLHAYQGYTPAQVVYLVRLSALLGARSLVVTNAAGSLRADLPPGSIVAISDHINLTGLNPLRGRLPAAWGPQFPDLADAYDPGCAAGSRNSASRPEHRSPRGSTPACSGRPSRLPPRFAPTAPWAPTWSACRPCSK